MLRTLFVLLLVQCLTEPGAAVASGQAGPGYVEVKLQSGLHGGGEKPIPRLRHASEAGSNSSTKVSAGETALIARLQAVLQDLPHAVAHLMPEIGRAKQLPGDPYRSHRPAKKVKRFSPGHHETPWLPKLTESDLKMHVPTWHGWVALRLPDGCRACEPVIAVVNEYARKSFHDHEMRMCASFAFVSDDEAAESDDSMYAAPSGPLLGSPPEPILVWLPPLHEVHNIHERPVIFNGPWTTVEVARFVSNRCTRAARIGRAFVGDSFASQFARATNVQKQQEILRGLRKLQWQYREGRMQEIVQQRLRYYEDMMHAAITEGVVGPDHFMRLSRRLEEQLQLEVYKDALAEVTLIKHNVVQAFLESTGDPTVLYNMVQMDVLAKAKEQAQRARGSS